MASTFRVLLVWLYGAEQYLDPYVDEELTPMQLTAIARAAGRSPHNFLMVVRRNWKTELQARDIRIPPELRELWQLPEGAAVDRLIGYQDGDHWRPGIAGLEPAESRALRWRVLEYRPTDDICRWLGVTPRTVYNHVCEAKRKLRRLLMVAAA